MLKVLDKLGKSLLQHAPSGLMLAGFDFELDFFLVNCANRDHSLLQYLSQTAKIRITVFLEITGI